MATPLRAMTVNEDHQPGDAEDRVLDAMKHDVETYGESRMTPGLIRERLEEIDNRTSKQNVNYALGQLTAAGWVRKISDGLYEFVDDPRDQ
jgi:hypothetical protein